MATAYEKIIYPKNVDFFREVSNGFNPENRVNAELVNKLQRALSAVQTSTKYTAKSNCATGLTIYTEAVTKRFKKGDGKAVDIDVTIPKDIADKYFDSAPFNRRWAVFASAIGYKKDRSGYTYFRLLCAVGNAFNENSNSCRVGVIKESGWDKGDILEVTVAIVRPI